MRGTRALLAVTVAMGVLIVAGVATLGVLIVQRLAVTAPAGPVVLQEPPGTRMSGTSLAGDRLTVQLSGGGPDRVVVLDLKTGRIAATITLPP